MPEHTCSSPAGSWLLQVTENWSEKNPERGAKFAPSISLWFGLGWALSWWEVVLGQFCALPDEKIKNKK